MLPVSLGCPYLQLFVGWLMSYLRYMCLFVYSDVQHILCCVFCFVCLRLVSRVTNVASFSGLSLSTVVCRLAHVLFTLYVFVCVQRCPTHIVLCFLFCLSLPPVICRRV